MKTATRLTGLIMTSPNPERTVEFYRDVIGLPFELNQHGTLPAHYECDVDGVHFAILKGDAVSSRNVTPSFEIENLDAFLAALEPRGIKPKHRVIALGGGPRISTIADPDGNDVRLYSAT
jgi:predicted enzyme related to lactoylglutathione lyase